MLKNDTPLENHKLDIIKHETQQLSVYKLICMTTKSESEVELYNCFLPPKLSQPN